MNFNKLPNIKRGNRIVEICIGGYGRERWILYHSVGTAFKGAETIDGSFDDAQKRAIEIVETKDGWGRTSLL